MAALKEAQPLDQSLDDEATRDHDEAINSLQEGPVVDFTDSDDDGDFQDKGPPGGKGLLLCIRHIALLAGLTSLQHGRSLDRRHGSHRCRQELIHTALHWQESAQRHDWARHGEL
jgi:hypothetical protein